MPILQWSKAYLRALTRQAIGKVQKLIAFGGLRYGTLGEVYGDPSAGVSSPAPRTARTDILVKSALDWRGQLAVVPQLNKVGNLTTSLDRGQETDFEWVPTGKTEDVIGELPQVDVLVADILEGVPSTAEHGLTCDAHWHETNAGGSGLTQFIDTGGSLLGETWTLSAWVANVDPNDTADRSVYLLIGDSTASEAGSTLRTYTGRGKWQRVSATKTFYVTTSHNLQGRIGHISFAGVPLLISAVQMEQSSVASLYERTSYTEQGVRNKFYGSHYPMRTPTGAPLIENSGVYNVWHVRILSGQRYRIISEAGRGPEIRAIVPPPGTMEFGVGRTGVTWPNGQVIMKQYDWWKGLGYLADRIRVNTGTGADISISQSIARSPAGGTLVGSCWMKIPAPASGYVVPAQGVYINLQASGGGGNSSILFPASVLTYAWRKYWWIWQPSAGTAVQFQIIIHGTGGSPSVAGEAIDVFGCQLEYHAGSLVTQLPKDYTHTNATPGSDTNNMLQYSAAVGTAPWTASANLTIDADIADPPVEYFQPWSPAYGGAYTLLRANHGGHSNYVGDWVFQTKAGGDANRPDTITGAIYSVGSYGEDVLNDTRVFRSEKLTNADCDSTTGWFLDTDGGASGTITLDTTVKEAGTGSIKMNRTAAGWNQIYQQLTGRTPGQWYLFFARVYGTGTVELAVNTPAADVYQGNYTWTAPGGAYYGLVSVTPGLAWKSIQTWVWISDAFTTSQAIQWRIANRGANGTYINVDSCRLYGGFTSPTGLDVGDFTQYYEHVPNGSFEDWPNPALPPYGWLMPGVPTTETWARDLDSAVADGMYSLKITRPIGSDGNYAGPRFLLPPLIPGAWYYVSWWHKQSQLSPNGASANRCLFNNDTRVQGCGADGVTWAPSASLVEGQGTLEWTKYGAWLQPSLTEHTIADVYSIRFPPYFGDGTGGHPATFEMSVWIDGVSVDGPHTSQLTTSYYLAGWDFNGPGSTTKITKRTGVEAFNDDEETYWTDGGIRTALAASQTSPIIYLNTTYEYSLPQGWYTARLRVARQDPTHKMRILIKRVSDGQYMSQSHVYFAATAFASSWLDPHLRDGGLNSPDYGVAVWHFYLPSTVDRYVFYVGGFTGGALSEMFFDSLRIWSNAGALYPSTDLTETAGNAQCLFQGLDVQFRGIIDGAIDGDDTKLRIRARDYIHGAGIEVPTRTAQPNCQIAFRGSECGYVNTTVIDLVESIPTTVHRCTTTAYLVAGRHIMNSARTSFARINSIVDATHFTTIEPQTYANGALVTYSECRRTYPDCARRGATGRGNTHRFAGFRATKAWEAVSVTPYYNTTSGSWAWPTLFPPTSIAAPAAQLIGAISMEGQKALEEKKIFDDEPIFLVYGRKSVKLQPIETHYTKLATDNSEWQTVFFAMGMGEIDSVRSFFTESGYLRHVPEEGLMIFWHPGYIGEDATWTQTDQFGAGAPNYLTGPSQTQKINNQRRDFRSNTDTAYSRVAYAILQKTRSAQNDNTTDPTQFDQVWADLKGIKIQIYDRQGRPVGSKVWSRNPVWQVVDILLNKVYGAALSMEIIDWASMVEAALMCDQPITSSEANTLTTTFGNSVAQGVLSVAGFAPEMPCTVNLVANTVIDVDPVNQRLFFANAVNTAPSSVFAVVGKPARYTCDILIKSKTSLAQILDDILMSCRGFITYDGGKIGVRIEVSATDATAAVWQVGTPTSLDKLGVKDGSVRFNQHKTGAQVFNMLEATYESAELIAGTVRTARFADADRGGLDFPRIMKIAASGCDTADQALRVSLPKLAKVSGATSSTEDAEQDSRGFSIESGPSMKRAQIGDFVQVTRLNRTPSKNARIRQITTTEDGRVKVDTTSEARKLRSDGFMTAIDPYTDSPSAEASQGTALALSGLSLSVASFTAATLHVQVLSTGYSVGPGTGMGSHVQALAAIEIHVSGHTGFIPTTGSIGMGGSLAFVLDPSSTTGSWSVPTAYLEVPIFVLAVGIQGFAGGAPAQIVQSLEVPITVYKTDRSASDPTQQEGSDATNMVYGGDFEPDSGWDTATDNAAPGYPGTNRFADPAIATSLETPASPALPVMSSGVIVYQTIRLEDKATFATYAHLGRMSDGSDTTYFFKQVGFQWSPLPQTSYIAEGIFRNFGTSGANKTGRVFIRYSRPTQADNVESGGMNLWYTLDATVASPVWVRINSVLIANPVTNPIPQTYYGPELTEIDFTKFGIGVAFSTTYLFQALGSHNADLRMEAVGFEEKTSATTSGSISGNVMAVHGDGTLYGNVKRPFPGNAPPPGVYVAFNANTLNHCRIQVRKQTATDTLDGNPLEIRLYDLDNPINEWIIASIPSSVITATFQDFAIKFSSAGPIQGSRLQVQVRTKNTKTIECDKLLIARGDTLFRWVASPENQAAGYFGDFSNGETQAFTKGSWTVDDVAGTVTRYVRKVSDVS